jgi:hypothetical protein
MKEPTFNIETPEGDFVALHAGDRVDIYMPGSGTHVDSMPTEDLEAYSMLSLGGNNVDNLKELQKWLKD